MISPYQQLTRIDGWDAEYFVADVLARNGYKTQTTRGSGDEGVDIVATELATNEEYEIQVKHSKKDRTTCKSSVKKYFRQAKQSSATFMMVTTTRFSDGAKKLMGRYNIESIDGSHLHKIVKKTDSLYLYDLYSNGPARLQTQQDLQERVDYLGTEFKDWVLDSLLESENPYGILARREGATPVEVQSCVP